MAYDRKLKQTPEMKMNFNFKPRDLQMDDYMKDKLSTPELNEFINLEKMRGARRCKYIIA